MPRRATTCLKSRQTSRREKIRTGYLIYTRQGGRRLVSRVPREAALAPDASLHKRLKYSLRINKLTGSTSYFLGNRSNVFKEAI